MSLFHTIAGSRLAAAEIAFPGYACAAAAQQLRAKLLTRGITLRAFSQAHGFAPRTVQAALRGERPTGRKSQLVLRKIAEVTA